MAELWEPYPDVAARWIRRLQSTILRRRPPRQACFVSIANAIEVQIEDGADPDVLRHLLRALLSSARGAGVEAAALGMHENEDATLAKIRPTGP